MRPIDLHTHTTHSDGSVSPAELVTLAAASGARAIAITDHDTVSGLAEGGQAAAKARVEFVNGVEISAEFSPGTMHILGYFIDDEAEGLLSKLHELKQARERRNPEIARKLRQLGFDLSYDEVAALAGNEVVGRPHFARVLVAKGYASSIQDAFNRFLAKGAPAYEEKLRLNPGDAISLIHGAAGVAVLAHPYQLKLGSMEETEELLGQLRECGLDGVEAIYSRHTPEQRRLYAAMAERLGLAATGGSDFHGSYKPDIAIVTGTGDLNVPYSILENLRRLAAQRREAAGTGRLTPSPNGRSARE